LIFFGSTISGITAITFFVFRISLLISSFSDSVRYGADNGFAQIKTLP
jgi:hypothetical protein